MPLTGVLIETTPLSGTAKGRGLGRYTSACRDAALALGLDVTEMRLRERGGRLAELVAIAERSARLIGSREQLLHCTAPGSWAAARLPTVTSILDVIHLDLAAHRRTGLKSRAVLGLASRSDVLLTLSSFSAARLVDRLQVDPSRVIVAPLPPASAFSGALTPALIPCPPHAPYVVSLLDVATRDPRKRAHWVKPLAAALGAHGVGLAVVGSDSERSPIDLGVAIGLGRLSDAEFATVLTGASAFLYFSAYEGQGLPPLEAMAVGTPVVAVRNTAVEEVVADGGILVEECPGNWDDAIRESADSAAVRQALAEYCLQIAGDAKLRALLSARGKARAAAFSPEAFRQNLAQAYDTAACA